MGILYLLRHAEADAGTPDIRRPLSANGRAAAKKLGQLMAERHYRPARVLCSEARRTQETLAGLALPSAAAVRKGIYDATPGDLLALVQDMPADAPSVLLVGHNPAIHELARFLAGEGDEQFIQSLRVSYKPGTLSVLSCAVDWKDLTPGCACIDDLIVPSA